MSDSGAALSPGDWICPDIDCRHVNFARRTQCNKCSRERSIGSDLDSPTNSGGAGNKKSTGIEIGKAAADKSRGLFSAEDWQCAKCGNVNWARRHTCNMCNVPRFSEAEERTGYGGGYNDRGVVEYKEREESDSEYDEFGRLKKRKNKEAVKLGSHDDDKQYKDKVQPLDDNDHVKMPESIDKNTENNAAHEEEEEEDEEEDDDDDGADLSKYDLWGDDGVSLTMNSINVRKEFNLSDSEDSASSHASSRSRGRSRSQSASSSSADERRAAKTSQRGRGRKDRSRSPFAPGKNRYRKPDYNQRSRDRSRSPLNVGLKRRNR